MPHRIITNILEGLETLDKIIPGVANDDTLLYGPEIKFFSNEIETDNNANNSALYDIQGRRIVAPVKGQIYIVNGKKFIGK